MSEIKVIITWTDSKTGLTTSEPQKVHIDCIAAALEKSMEEDGQRIAG